MVFKKAAVYTLPVFHRDFCIKVATINEGIKAKARWGSKLEMGIMPFL